MVERQGNSRAEQIIRERKDAPLVSPRMAQAVSRERRERLEDEARAGHFREPGAVGDTTNQPTVASTAVGSGKGLLRLAQEAGHGGGHGVTTQQGGHGFRGAAGSTVRQAPEVYSPLWLNSNLNLPRDRATLNAWSRSFFALNPIVQNAITLHSTYPIAKLNITSHNPKVEQFFADMAEEMDLMGKCVEIAQEFWVVGEAFVYAELDQSTAKWSRLLIQNPDYITVRRSVIAGEPIVSLRPDENLKRVVQSNNPVDIQQRQQLDPSIIEHVRRGENIPLNNFYISHLARRISPYEVRGTSAIVSCFRALMLLDLLMESKYVQAYGMVNPLTLVKIGNQDFRPNPVDLQAWRQIFEEAQYDKDFKIFTHDAVSVERVGYNQGILDISADLDRLVKWIYIGLMVPSVIMDGSDTTYATGSVALDVLRQRYMQFRTMLSAWLRRKIFAPIAKLNDFYEYQDGKKVLVVPEIDWNHMSLFDMSDYINNLIQLTQGEVNQRKVSLHTVYRSLGLDFDDEQRQLRTENVSEVIRQKELAALQTYPIAELRALGPDDEVDEKEEAPLPGQAPAGAAPPGGMGGGAGGGLGLGPMGAPEAPIGMGGGGGGGPPPPADLGGGGGGGAPPPPA